MKTSEDLTTFEILHRLVIPIQTRGNLGKSTEAIARGEWMNERSVAWRGYDLDAFNRTLSTTYPEDVVFVEPGPEPEGELIKIFRGLAQSKVTVIDPSAHMNRAILRAMEMVRLTQLCEAIAGRVPVLIYPVDEVSDMDGIAQTVEVLGDSVDWVIVRNPVKIPTTKFFQGSDLERELLGFGAVRLAATAGRVPDPWQLASSALIRASLRLDEDLYCMLPGATGHFGVRASEVGLGERRLSIGWRSA